VGGERLEEKTNVGVAAVAEGLACEIRAAVGRNLKKGSKGKATCRIDES